MLNQALSGLRVAARTTDWDVWIFEYSVALPPSGAGFPYEKQATDKICAPLAADNREVDVCALKTRGHRLILVQGNDARSFVTHERITSKSR